MNRGGSVYDHAFLPLPAPDLRLSGFTLGAPGARLFASDRKFSVRGLWLPSWALSDYGSVLRCVTKPGGQVLMFNKPCKAPRNSCALRVPNAFQTLTQMFCRRFSYIDTNVLPARLRHRHKCFASASQTLTQILCQRVSDIGTNILPVRLRHLHKYFANASPTLTQILCQRFSDIDTNVLPTRLRH